MPIAVDTNVLLDCADGNDDVLDALDTFRKRLRNQELVATTTVVQELAMAARKEGDVGELALCALQHLLAWGVRPLDLLSVEHAIAEQIGLKLRLAGLVPPEEIHDSLIIAEAAVSGCTILLSSDEHLLAAGRNAEATLWAVLEQCHTQVTRLVIAKPADIARRFFPG